MAYADGARMADHGAHREGVRLDGADCTRLAAIQTEIIVAMQRASELRKQALLEDEAVMRLAREAERILDCATGREHERDRRSR